MDERALASVIFEKLDACLQRREHYIRISCQASCDNPKDDLENVWEGLLPENTGQVMYERIPEASPCIIALGEDGVYRVYENEEALMGEKPLIHVPTLRDYYVDLEILYYLCNDGPAKTLAFRRLRFLQAQFVLYCLTTEQAEKEAQKRVPHRDFYNVRKVDTHVHHSSCMNCKHLLRFIRRKVNSSPQDVVIHRDGMDLTLEQVFKSLNLTAYDLSIDSMDMHAHKDSFHRFDRFNLKYNPIGESRLREVFLKTDNMIKGRYLAELSREVIAELEASKFQTVEWRLSIYGRSKEEWDKLAAWVVDNKLFSDNVRWIIQIPRLYELYKRAEEVQSFEGYLKNIFEPLFHVTQDPSANPKLHHFLKRVVGFDTVDDESKAERRVHKKYPFPKFWCSELNPPYSYFLYYLYANVASVNAFRKSRGMNTFTLRPHCGEAGDPNHLAAAFLTSTGINHGILLRKVPVLQYLYYLAQIHISLSPLSNNALFLTYDRNPFLDFFQRGLRVTLSTDDPLQFHYTREPLMEEYSVAAQIWKLSSSDMCEIARNSVLASGFEARVKRQWLGNKYEMGGAAGNHIEKTNIPDERLEFRNGLLIQEREMVRSKRGLMLPTVVDTLPIEQVEMANEIDGAKSLF